MTATVCIPDGFITHVPAQSNRMVGSGLGASVGVFRLPTDPLRYVNLTFDGAIAGSEIRCYLDSDGTELFGVESCDADHVFSGVPYFGTGQDTTIRIVNSAYRIKEFPYAIPAVDQVIPIQMEADKWYSNPA
ncbi:MAG: hypothetical protein MUE63_06415 [Xanthomonadales bacterium]|jgi:hypothetical protein|nr:hypothetical protein [Xanthomonadales bacterium]